MMRNNFFWIIFLFNALGIAAQNPVDIKCFADDSLYWEFAEDPGCIFLEHQIFYAQDLGDVFINAGVIDDATLESFDFSSFGFLSETFFFISSTFDCGSTEVVVSDTISSLPPDLVEISYLDVTDDGIIVNWIDQLNDPADHQYIIYYSDAGSVDEIGTVSGVNSYLDEDVAPVEMAETYYVLAQDACGNVSIFDTPHTSMFLFSSFDACLNAFDVGWTLMEDAVFELDSLRLNIEHPSSGLSKFVAADIDQDGMFYNIDSGMGEYCLELYAYYPNGDVATSNQVCIDASTIPQLETYQISNVTNTGNSTQIVWLADDEDAVKEFEVVGTDIDGQSVWESGVVDFNTIVNPSVEDLINWESEDGLINYVVHFENFCGFTYTTEAFSNIHLTVNVDDNGKAFFEWQAVTPDYITPLGYTLYKIEGQIEKELALDFNTGTSGFYQLSAADLKSDRLEFMIERSATFENMSSGQLETVRSLSNRVRYIPEVKLVLPNAINPNSKNNVFKPVLVSGSVDDYFLSIYDRFGQLLFVSDRIEEGWKGKDDLEFYPAGVYQYAIRVVDVQGVEYEYAGVLTLVR